MYCLNSEFKIELDVSSWACTYWRLDTECIEYTYVDGELWSMKCKEKEYLLNK